MKNHVSILSILAATAFAPGDGQPGWKLDATGNFEKGADGNPIYVDASGREMAVDSNTISRLNGEAKTHREAKEKLEAELAKFKDIKDPAAAAAALQKLSEIDQSKLIDSGKLDEVKQQITAQFQQQIAEKDKALSDLQSQFDNAQISNLFAQSDFIRERIAVPRDMFEASFRQNFKIEDGKIVPYGRDGNRLMSKKKLGEFADPQEAFELLVEQHPQKDVILKATDANGTGNNGGGGGRGGVRTITREQWEKSAPSAQAELAQKQRAGEIQIVD